MVSTTMSDWRTLQEVARDARLRLTPAVWDYLEGGAESETSMRRNRQALDSIAFRPRVLRNVVAVDGSSRLLGHRMRLPVAVAPCGSVLDIHPGGTLAIAKAAETFGILSFFSASSPTPPTAEDITAATRHPKVYQMSIKGEPTEADDKIRRAVDAGFVAIGFTLDAVVPGRRERDLINRHVPIARRNLPAPTPSSATPKPASTTLTWDHVKRVKDKFGVPIVLKAIVTGEDARLAVEHGVDVIYISNHGGRQLDHSRATIDVLPEVVAAVDGKAEIVIDGGFLRGTDVLKAIALGADAVAVGRLMCLGLAAGGEAGIVRTFELLEAEILTAMALLGVTSLAELDPSYVTTARPVAPPGLSSAYPLLGERVAG